MFLFPRSSDYDDEVPLVKSAKLISERTESAKESNPSPADPTPPSRTTVAKVPVSKVNPSVGAPVPPTARDHISKPPSSILFYD
jgi:hypothetical protein